ncbi:MAG: MaoC family dehydratase, partial [Rhodospirillales bacterium]|nr:MaoC family dehydratase [Rhodospirillales bacterium]
MAAAGGNFFEDFRLGQEFRHASPRTLTAGDAALYTALTGSRFAVHSSAEFARRLGLGDAPLDDLLVFHVVFGKTVPDISLNALANLGYAEGRFAVPVHAGDTLAARSTVIGLKTNSDRKAGIVWVRTTGENQRGESVVEYVRWVMVPAQRAPLPPADPVIPALADAIPAERLVVPPGFALAGWDATLAGDTRRWGDYRPGERIDHVAGMTIKEAEHQLATRLYQNPAHVHFDQRLAAGTRFGRRLVYGGHVMSIARALSFAGLAGIVRIAAINGGRHVAPVFAGDTLYAWTEIRAAWPVPGRTDLGALRLETVATKDHPRTDFPQKSAS